ncbi:KpsF/GutQ family sugar-phosphate isomerase [Parafilimonas terrae]|uniref:Arabinose-5-phosphate isomerase n=1 Tax=Parafilimonas terrae TaxID=1465490 RepID=A0A1I5VZ52_9BACT|nr:KpsF/GutQ family sugar-phosphate isomerase [Parafilimonas terrae]SFQ12745.1 arabinose-5-phosphate isomerase [Parafilimonas terrae]
MKTSAQSSALYTIEQEANAIANLKNFIDDSFDKAVNAIRHASGRVVITGIGKSAIVAQKIVATLNSTGTPSLFMHAADAIHGDLGMIQEKDVVIILSKSGESDEIKVLVPLIKNAGNIIIAIAGNNVSFLAQHADIFLNTTVSKEACPNNLAPTSSTTAQMVMGDALAVCLMQLNGFDSNDFAKFHPGGNLGKRLYLRVNDIYKMNGSPSVKEDVLFKDVIFSISDGRLGATVVLNDNKKITGIITDGDIRRLFEKTDDVKHLKASEISKANPKTILNTALAVEALEKMNSNSITQLIVVDEQDSYLGFIHLHDLIREGII